MNFGFQIFPDPASEFAPKVDMLYYFLTAVTAFFTLLIFGVLFYTAFRYRRRDLKVPAATNTSAFLEFLWSVIPLGICFIIFFWSAYLYIDVYKTPKDPLDIHVVGKQWMWKVQHPHGNREINELHVPTGRTVQLTISSQDVIHSFFIPAFRIKQDAVPGRYTRTSFTPTKPGVYHLFCNEYCGTWHSSMIGKVTVLEPDKYEAWLAGTLPGETPAASGQKLFQSLGCITCHGVQGPSIAGIYQSKRRVLKNGLGEAYEVIADDDYLRKSILYSTEEVVEGYRPIMPSFRNQISEDQLQQLIAYIKSMQNPDQPNRAPQNAMEQSGR